MVMASIQPSIFWWRITTTFPPFSSLTIWPRRANCFAPSVDARVDETPQPATQKIAARAMERVEYRSNRFTVPLYFFPTTLML